MFKKLLFSFLIMFIGFVGINVTYGFSEVKEEEIFSMSGDYNIITQTGNKIELEMYNQNNLYKALPFFYVSGLEEFAEPIKVAYWNSGDTTIEYGSGGFVDLSEFGVCDSNFSYSYNSGDNKASLTCETTQSDVDFTKSNIFKIYIEGSTYQWDYSDKILSGDYGIQSSRSTSTHKNYINNKMYLFHPFCKFNTKTDDIANYISTGDVIELNKNLPYYSTSIDIKIEEITDYNSFYANASGNKLNISNQYDNFKWKNDSVFGSLNSGDYEIKVHNASSYDYEIIIDGNTEKDNCGIYSYYYGDDFYDAISDGYTHARDRELFAIMNAYHITGYHNVTGYNNDMFWLHPSENHQQKLAISGANDWGGASEFNLIYNNQDVEAYYVYGFGFGFQLNISGSNLNALSDDLNNNSDTNIIYKTSSDTSGDNKTLKNICTSQSPDDGFGGNGSYNYSVNYDSNDGNIYVNCYPDGAYSNTDDGDSSYTNYINFDIPISSSKFDGKTSGDIVEVSLSDSTFNEINNMYNSGYLNGAKTSLFGKNNITDKPHMDVTSLCSSDKYLTGARNSFGCTINGSGDDVSQYDSLSLGFIIDNNIDKSKIEFINDSNGNMVYIKEKIFDKEIKSYTLVNNFDFFEIEDNNGDIYTRMVEFVGSDLCYSEETLDVFNEKGSGVMYSGGNTYYGCDTDYDSSSSDTTNDTTNDTTTTTNTGSNVIFDIPMSGSKFDGKTSGDIVEIGLTNDAFNRIKDFFSSGYLQGEYTSFYGHNDITDSVSNNITSLCSSDKYLTGARNSFGCTINGSGDDISQFNKVSFGVVLTGDTSQSAVEFTKDSSGTVLYVKDKIFNKEITSDTLIKNFGQFELKDSYGRTFVDLGGSEICSTDRAVDLSNEKGSGIGLINGDTILGCDVYTGDATIDTSSYTLDENWISNWGVEPFTVEKCLNSDCTDTNTLISSGIWNGVVDGRISDLLYGPAGSSNTEANYNYKQYISTGDRLKFIDNENNIYGIYTIEDINPNWQSSDYVIDTYFSGNNTTTTSSSNDWVTDWGTEPFTVEKCLNSDCSDVNTLISSGSRDSIVGNRIVDFLYGPAWSSTGQAEDDYQQYISIGDKLKFVDNENNIYGIYTIDEIIPNWQGSDYVVDTYFNDSNIITGTISSDTTDDTTNTTNTNVMFDIPMSGSKFDGKTSGDIVEIGLTNDAFNRIKDFFDSGYLQKDYVSFYGHNDITSSPSNDITSLCASFEKYLTGDRNSFGCTINGSGDDVSQFNKISFGVVLTGDTSQSAVEFTKDSNGTVLYVKDKVFNKEIQASSLINNFSVFEIKDPYGRTFVEVAGSNGCYSEETLDVFNEKGSGVMYSGGNTYYGCDTDYDSSSSDTSPTSGETTIDLEDNTTISINTGYTKMNNDDINGFKDTANNLIGKTDKQAEEFVKKNLKLEAYNTMIKGYMSILQDALIKDDKTECNELSIFGRSQVERCKELVEY